VSQGQNAGIVQKEKDPVRDTTFATTVAIPPGDEAFFWLVYEQQLSRSYSKYNYKTNIRPFQKVDLLQVKVNIMESRPIKMGRTNVKFSNESGRKRRSGGDSFNLTKESGKSISYTYELAGDPDEFMDSVEVTYDVERPKLDGGDILVRDGYFVHFLSPEDLPPIAKNIIFVIDKSGSMSGQRILQTKEAFQWIIKDLNEEDFFQIVTFDSDARTLYNEFQPVNAETRKDGVSKVSSINAGGSTNIDRAMRVAVEQRNDNDAANIIIFISDGEPTAGESNWINIRANAARANDGYYAIFSFAIGSSAPYSDLERLSSMNNGLARQIFSDTEVLDQIKDFYHGVATPLVWNAKIEYENAEEVIQSSPMVFAGGETAILGKLKDKCSAPVPSCNKNLLVKAELGSFCSDTQNMEIDCDERPTPPPFDPSDDSRDKMDNPKMAVDSDINLKQYFAYLKMRKWLKIYKATDDETQREAMKEKLTQQAVDNQFVTRFTAMVVVEDETSAKKLTKVRRSAEFKAELQRLWEEKTLRDMEGMERSRRSAAFSTQSQPSSQIPMRKIFGILLILSALVKFRKSPFRALNRFFY